MIATISPVPSAFRHTRNTLHYAGTASTIKTAPPRPATNDLELRNSELEQASAALVLHYHAIMVAHYDYHTMTAIL